MIGLLPVFVVLISETRRQNNDSVLIFNVQIAGNACFQFIRKMFCWYLKYLEVSVLVSLGRMERKRENSLTSQKPKMVVYVQEHVYISVHKPMRLHTLGTARVCTFTGTHEDLDECKSPYTHTIHTSHKQVWTQPSYTPHTLEHPHLH